MKIAHGIYRITLYPTSANEDLFIALLKSGEKAVLSHESALVVYQISDVMPGEIHVTIPRTSSRRREGIIFHTKTINQSEITQYEGLRVTTVPRTIIDLLESGFDPVQLEKAIDEALQRGLTTKGELLDTARNRRASTGKALSQYLDQVGQ